MAKKIESKSPAILLDADVIIHFEKAGHILLLGKIFPNNEKLILDKVLKELEVLPGTRPFAANIVNFRIARPIEFESDSRVKMEYAKLIKKFGKGESACMAYCKFHNNILASSNIRDVKQYCLDNDIQLISTMDFLVEALQSGILTESDCDFFIYNVKMKGSILPCNSIAAYKSMLGI
jgi:hypothetical protein